ncbi:hypothetical protein IC582_024743 [Cucumis melo]
MPSLLLLFFLPLHFSSAAHQTLPPEIAAACNSTRFPDQCASSISQSNRLLQNPTPLQIIQAALYLSSENLKTAKSMVKAILDSAEKIPNRNRTAAALSCMDALGYSEYRISLSNDAIPLGRIKDARAWLSASLLYQTGCRSGLKYVNDTHEVDQTMSFLDNLTVLSSNALSMVVAYDNFGNETAAWLPPRTERDGFWEHSSGTGEVVRGVRIPAKTEVNVTVCKDGSEGCYRTVQAAVEAAPGESAVRFVIHIKEGVYEESVRVGIEKKNLVFLGDGMGKTVITGSLSVGQPGISTYNSATVGVLGDGFIASELTIQNTAGPDVHQAVAFRSDSDLSIIHNCEFISNQDTLYAHSLRQFYNSCRILGNVDFIFGNSASFFLNCHILVRPHPLNPQLGDENPITAHGRTDPAQSTGFVFQNCLLNGTEEFMALYYANPQRHRTFLGRPWKEYSRTVFIHCELEALVSSSGWMPWSGDIGLNTLYYGEFENFGTGSNSSKRVAWSNQIPAEHAFSYSIQNFIQGNEWIPSS